MGGRKRIVSDILFMAVTLGVTFLVNLHLVGQIGTKTLTPMIFVLGVFLVSWRTQGYVWGILTSLISVLAVNWAFTYPYWAVDLISPECIASAVVMLIVSVMTGALTTRLKKQEKLKAEAERERLLFLCHRFLPQPGVSAGGDEISLSGGSHQDSKPLQL